MRAVARAKSVHANVLVGPSAIGSPVPASSCLRCYARAHYEQLVRAASLCQEVALSGVNCSQVGDVGDVG